MDDRDLVVVDLDFRKSRLVGRVGLGSLKLSVSLCKLSPGYLTRRYFKPVPILVIFLSLIAMLDTTMLRLIKPRYKAVVHFEALLFILAA